MNPSRQDFRTLLLVVTQLTQVVESINASLPDGMARFDARLDIRNVTRELEQLERATRDVEGL